MWKAATGKEPPANPADPDVAMREALLWAAVSGTLVAVARMLATRRAAQLLRPLDRAPAGRGRRRRVRVRRPRTRNVEEHGNGRLPLRREAAVVAFDEAAQAQSRQISFFSSASWLRWCTRKQLMQVNSSS